MCGIVGFVCDKTEYIGLVADAIIRRKWFHRALIADMVRGEDSTGIFTIPFLDAEGKELCDPLLFKKSVPASDFIHFNQYIDAMQDIDNYQLVVGHNRWATSGKISARNAHPFHFDNITLVHNGTLTNTSYLNSNCMVDSAQIAEDFSTRGAEEVLPLLQGAYTLVWYDKDDHSFNMARNSERPMHFSFNKDGNTMYFASEDWMISHLYKDIDLIQQKVYKLAVGKWVKFYLQGDDPLTQYKVIEFTPHVKPKNIYAQAWPTEYKTPHTAVKKSKEDIEYEIQKKYNFWWHRPLRMYLTEYIEYNKRQPTADITGTLRGTLTTKDGQTIMVSIYGVKKSMINEEALKEGRLSAMVTKQEIWEVNNRSHANASGTIKSIEEDTEENIYFQDELPMFTSYETEEEEDIEEYVLGPTGELITIKEFDKVTKHGCVFCTTNIDPEDADDIDWTETNDPICVDCSEQFNKINMN